MSIQRLNAPWAARIGWTASHSAAGCSLEAMAGRSWGYEDYGLWIGIWNMDWNMEYGLE